MTGEFGASACQAVSVSEMARIIFNLSQSINITLSGKQYERGENY